MRSATWANRPASSAAARGRWQAGACCATGARSSPSLGLVVIVVLCLLAGWYAHSVAHTNPFESTVDGTTIIDGKVQPVMVESSGGLGLGVTPIGPTWDIHHYFLGADSQGRDVAARMLYGGRNSLIIGTASALFCCFFATIIALIAGFFGGLTDQILSRVLDVIWAFPVFLLAISVSTVALTSDIPIGPVTLSAGSLWLPIFLISVIYVPYVARPIRGQVLSIREKEFVEASIGLGASNLRLIFSEVLPNVITTVIVFFPLMIAHEHADRVGALVPLDRRAAARRELGHDHQRRPGVALHATLGGDCAWARDRRDRALPERAGRRRARCARSRARA